MYLILTTYANAYEAEPMCACAVLEVDNALLTYLSGAMTFAARICAERGTDVTIAWNDWLPECFEVSPETEEYEAEAEDIDDSGWCLLARHPYPQPQSPQAEELEDARPPWHQPVRLTACELRASAQAVRWWYCTREGNYEEYTAEVTRQTLEDIRSAMTQTTLPLG